MISNILMTVLSHFLKLLADLFEVGLHEPAAVQAQVAEAVDGRGLIIDTFHVNFNYLHIF